MNWLGSVRERGQKAPFSERLRIPRNRRAAARLRPFSRTAPPHMLAASFGLRRGADAAPAPGVRAGLLVLGAHPKTLEVGRFAHTLPQPIITAQMRRASWADSGADGCGVRNVRVGPRTRRFAGWGLGRGPSKALSEQSGEGQHILSILLDPVARA
jgi:hypothetical protein